MINVTSIGNHILYFIHYFLLVVSLDASEADNIDIVSICLQIKEKVFHEMALLQASEPRPAPGYCYFWFKLGAASKKLHSIFCSCCCKNRYFLTLDLWSDVSVWILISVSFFISRQLLPLKMENHKCMPGIRYLSSPRNLCSKAFQWRQFVHQTWDAMAHWAASVLPVIDAHLTKYLYCDYSIQLLHKETFQT